MSRKGPLLTRIHPESRFAGITRRGIVSPCEGCKNAVGVHVGRDDPGTGSETRGWPCPKKVLLAQAEALRHSGNSGGRDLDGPAYQEELLPINPQWTGRHHDRPYNLVYVAFHEDNPDNPDFDTERIRCRGPFLVGPSERESIAAGRLRPEDPVVVQLAPKDIGFGVTLFGWAWPGQDGRSAHGEPRKIDFNLGQTLAGNV